ncbi:molybdopterin molybdotransferase MoeA [Nisaea sediminum]|uniref:molybdopterin molybdotransferase MoeA n=1 Tax=Nisaea sediminum TaxID=2775867 RepID=UPI001865F003|nr:gephyrin-like molybdotransferase Glp [Nisaea sediminum]
MPRDIVEDNCGCDRFLSDCPQMMSVAAAEKLAQSLADRIRETELVSLDQAVGRTLARDLSAPRGMPFFDGSAMDGYAVRLCELDGEAPWRLRVTAEIPAGTTMTGAAESGAMRIFTGAALPDGYDAVVMQEDCVRTGDFISIERRPAPGENVRRAGSDLARGTVLVQAGTRIAPRHVGLLAANGYSAVNVIRRPRIALLSTGDELAEAGRKLSKGQVYDANRPMLLAMLKEAGAEVEDGGTLPDTPERTAARFTELAGRFDAVISTGAVSVGDHDHVKAAFRHAGGSILQWRVAMKPGKPVVFGRLGAMAFVGLPGNPYAAYVGAGLFVLPLVRSLTGAPPKPFAPLQAVAGFEIRKKPGRAEFLPVRMAGSDPSGLPVVVAQRQTSSATLFPLSEADGIVILPAETEATRAGDLLQLRLFC